MSKQQNIFITKPDFFSIRCGLRSSRVWLTFLRHSFGPKSKVQIFMNIKPQKCAQSVKQQPHQLYRALLEINCLFICKGGVSKSTIITTSSYVKHHCFHHFLVTSFYSWMYYKTTCLIGDKPI